MRNLKTELLEEVATYYSDKLAEHGDTPRGVDWNSVESQTVRFDQLCKVIDPRIPHFSINDLGCGYGALLGYIETTYSPQQYLGIDVSAEMIEAATKRYRSAPRARFIISSEPDQISDYGVASGIFNVKQERSNQEWFRYLQSTLDTLDRTSKRGFSFNCLTSYSDEAKKRANLYYADPCLLFDLCKRRYSQHVALLHDYGLYEFTILVRKMS